MPGSSIPDVKLRLRVLREDAAEERTIAGAMREYLRSKDLIPLLEILIDMQTEIEDLYEAIAKIEATDTRIEKEETKLETEVAQLEKEVPGPPVKATIRFGGNMPGTITVDVTNETVELTLEDDQGNDTPFPAGGSIAWSTDNPAIATVNQDPANPNQGDVVVTPGAGDVGVVNISAALSGVLEGDGATAVPDPAPIALTVTPGAPVGSRLALSV